MSKRESGRGDSRHRDGKTPNQRQLRVGEELRHVIAALLERDEFRDPDLLGRVITVTEVRISPDLRNATAFVVPLGGEHAPEIMRGLRRVAPYMRVLVGRELTLRHVPQLSFELDRSFDYAAKISQLLHQPVVQRDLSETEAAEAPSGDPASDGG